MERAGDASPRHWDAAQLYAREHERVHRICLHMLGNASDADDVVQETFARVARQLDRVQRDPSSYLFAVARNLCRDELRRRGRQVLSAEPQTSPSESVEQRVVDRDTVASTWMGLSPRDRTALRYVADGLSNDEIAARLGGSNNAAAQLVSRARRRARLHIERMTGHLPPPVVPRGRLLQSRLVHSLSRATDGLVTRLQGAAAMTGPAAATAAAVLTTVAPTTAAAPAAHLPRGLIAATSMRPSPSAPGTGVAVQVSTRGQVQVGAGVHTGDAPPKGPPASPSSRPNDSLLVPSSQDGTDVDAFGASPTYAGDHTVFAAGTDPQSCPAGCPVLWRSSDGGTTWTSAGAVGWQQFCSPVPAPGFDGNHVVLGACGHGGMLRSDDGGATFQPLLNSSVAAVVADPTSPPGDPRAVVIAGGVLLVHHVATRTFTPGPALPPGWQASAVAVDPGSGDLLVGGAMTGAGSGLLRCSATQCTTLAGLPWPPSSVALSPDFDRDGTMVVASGDSALVSHDGGATLAALPTGHAFDTFVEFLDAAHVLAVVRDSGGAPLLALSQDGARSFATVPGASPLRARAYLALPDGRFLAGLWAGAMADPMGIRCSTDEARTWHLSC